MTDAEAPTWALLQALMTGQERSDAWQKAGLWALATLERELGPRWVDRTWLRCGEIPGAIESAPFSMFGYVELLELALRLDLCRSVSGYDRVLRGLKRNPVVDDTMHLRAQLQLAELAYRHGSLLALEPSIPESAARADVAMDLGGAQFLVEAAVLRRPDAVVRSNQWFDRVNHAFLQIELDHDVAISGGFDRELSEVETQELLDTVARAAGFVSRGGVFPPVTQDGARLVVSAERGETSLTGPRSEWDSGARLDQTILDKAAQTKDAHAWIVVQLLDGLFYSDPWRAASLTDKLQALAARIRPLIEPWSHVRGVIVENGAIFVDTRDGSETAELDGASALHYPLPPIRHREVMIIGRTDASRVVAAWADAYGSEPQSLDQGLGRVGLPTAEEIFLPSG